MAALPLEQGAAAACPRPCTWERTFGGSAVDKAYGIVPLPGGDLMVAGNTRRSGRRSDDAWVLRLSAAGTQRWQRTMGGLDIDQLFAIAGAPDGDVVLAGHTRSRGAGRSDFWIVRLGANGRVLWQRTLGGPGEDRARAVIALPDGGVLVGGFTGSTGENRRDAWLVRLDPAGRTLWDRKLGGRGDDGAFHLARSENGDLFMAGYTSSPAGGAYQAWVVGLRDDGAVRWQRTYAQGVFAAATGIAVAADGTLALAGFAQPSRDVQDRVWVFRIDANGDLLWQRLFDGVRRDTAWAIAVTRDQDLIVAAAIGSRGAGSNDAWILALGDDGRVLWERLYGGKLWDRPTSLALTRDGNILVGGYTTSRGAGYEDFWILRLDHDGRLHPTVE